MDGLIDDACGQLKVVWFNQRWLGKRLEGEPEFYFYGQVRAARGGALELVNPEIEKVESDAERIVPVYPHIGKWGGRRLRGLIEQCRPVADLWSDPLPGNLRTRYELPDYVNVIRELHRPSLPEAAAEREVLLGELNDHRSVFHRRLVFDELLSFACLMESRRRERSVLKAPRIRVRDTDIDSGISLLPFSLTHAQSRVVREIAADLVRGNPMARLVQGDVGSGKTAVALMAMLMVLESGYQVAFMAPTELLAEQHFRTLEALLGPAGYLPQLLTSSRPAGERRAIRSDLKQGISRLVVGTHALFQESSRYRNLGLVVIDEQHRFGVAQRKALAEKGISPHVLVMTATPIPRSLALTVYGDLDLSLIDELPPGRKPVRTHLRTDEARAKVFEFLRSEIAQGGRVFIVYPLIDASDEITAAALTEHEQEVRDLLPGVDIGVVHGRLSGEQREAETQRFRDGSVQVLLATTVIEVGVDVPEATVMVIESAQRFGLSQLHQLRGRVGRSGRPAWCVLLADEQLGEEAERRLKVMCRTNDGFEIAEADLEHRGPGELIGTRQWGPAGFRFANLVRDRILIEKVKTVASHLKDAGLLEEVLAGLARYVPEDANVGPA